MEQLELPLFKPTRWKITYINNHVHQTIETSDKRFAKWFELLSDWKVEVIEINGTITTTI